MPSLEMFSELGVFTRPGFLEPDLCTRICSEMSVAPQEPARVAFGSAYSVDETLRRAKVVEVPRQSRALVEERLHAALPDVGRFFGLDNTKQERLVFLRYVAGDFFRFHTDSNQAEDTFDHIKARRVSLIVFLNNEAEIGEGAGYEGGALTLYGLIRKAPFERLGLPLGGETGLLVAFHSDIFHEVKPVTQGERYTVVTWLAGAESAS